MPAEATKTAPITASSSATNFAELLFACARGGTIFGAVVTVAESAGTVSGCVGSTWVDDICLSIGGGEESRAKGGDGSPVEASAELTAGTTAEIGPLETGATYCNPGSSCRCRAIRAVSISFIDCQRAAGSFGKQRRMICSSNGGTSGADS